jgi:hypothetical protein
MTVAHLPQPTDRGEVFRVDGHGNGKSTIHIDMAGMEIQAGDRVEVRVRSRRVDVQWETEHDDDDTAGLSGYSGGLCLADLDGGVAGSCFRRIT